MPTADDFWLKGIGTRPEAPDSKTFAGRRPAADAGPGLLRGHFRLNCDSRCRYVNADDL